MKVLWIVNSLLNKFSLKLYNKPSSGLWMDALLEDFRGREGYEIVVATPRRLKKTVKFSDGNITYYALPDNVPLLYNENKKRNIRAWQQLLDQEKPDLIQVWGTEFTHGLCALRLAKNIPSIVVIQGLLCEIAKYYKAGISEHNLHKYVTFRDVLRRDSMLQQQKKYFKMSKKEAEMLSLSGRVIGENEWCYANVSAINKDIRIYKCPMSINNIFTKYNWDSATVEKHSIICNASGYTIKGLHILLEAVAILKNKFEDIKLYVPGDPVVKPNTLEWHIRKNGYSLYIERLISKLHLNDNVVWLGNLSQEELAIEYTKHGVFVMPSAIENQSSSLIEAMMIGMPVVASAVGGVPDYVVHGENGFLYRFESYSALAYYVEKIFTDDKLADRLSVNAKKSMQQSHIQSKITQQMIDIYKEIVCR